MSAPFLVPADQVSKALPYLDPGSGSFILQLLLASLLGTLFIIKAFWKKIVTFFKREKPESKDTESEESRK